MWRLLLPLALAAAQGAQYGEYGAVKMPAYGDYDASREAEDYRRPADASLDYKDDEESKGNTDKPLNKEYRNGDSWRKPSRKQSKRVHNEEEYSEASDVNRRDAERKYRGGRDETADDRAPSEDKRTAVRPRKRRPPDEDFSIEKYIQGINENNLEVDVRRSTERIIRRKPRDRENPDIGPSAAAYRNQEFDEEAALLAMGRAPPPLPKDVGQFMPDFREDVRSAERTDETDDSMRQPDSMAMLPVEKRVRPEPEDVGPRRRPSLPHSEEERGPPRLRPAQRARLDPGAAEYDSDYYDLKRLRNMRRKPDFNRRPEASEEDNANLAPGLPFAELDELEREDGRRAFQLGRTPAGRPTTRRRTTTRRTTKRPTTPRRITTPTTTIPTTSLSTTTVTKAAPTLTISRNASKDLSLAEKSRLSIMKKASRKERIGGPSTTKPPVLIQVTSMMPTVVMVASSTTGDPWLRAREVAGDSPETLAKVRQLMRAKLVANAKDIRDLTEDWDREVCDYVDVKLLENAAPPPYSIPSVVLLVLCALAKSL